MNSKKMIALVIAALLGGGCIVSSGEEIEDVELEASESSHPEAPTDNAQDQAAAQPSVLAWRSTTPVPDTDNPNHLPTCFEEGAPCNGGAVCTETNWGLVCLRPQPTRAELDEE